MVLQKIEKKCFKTTIEKINGLEKEIEKLSDNNFAERTNNLKKIVSDNGDLDKVLPEAFALVREASKRTIGQRHYDVQLMVNCSPSGKISEMKTGEGKLWLPPWQLI